nr:unnamed protein product [Callosobruchus chinensis]
MEQDSKGNQKLFYRVLKGMKNPSQYHLQDIKDKNNEVITEGLGSWDNGTMETTLPRVTQYRHYK